MKKQIFIFAALAALAIITIACSLVSSTAPDRQEPSNTVLLDRSVTIPGGGGNADIAFQASNGQRIQILLSASNASVQPYASLQLPDGTSVYNPPINTAVNGTNRAEMIISQSGQYTLTLFDSSNQGGTISVKVIALK